MTALYGIWHQPSGLKNIANRLRFRVEVLRDELVKLGVKTITDKNNYFDTVVLDCNASGFSSSDFVLSEFHKNDINLRKVNENLVGITINETTTIDDLADIIEIFALIKEVSNEKGSYLSPSRFEDLVFKGIPAAIARKSDFMQ